MRELEAEPNHSNLRINSDRVILVAGRGNIPLSQKIAELLGKKLYIPGSNFADGETDVKFDLDEVDIAENDIYPIQSTQPRILPNGLGTNDHVMELYFMNKALKRAGARQITDVIPFFGYQRADADRPGGTLGAADVARLLTKKTKVQRLISVDLHNPAIKMAVEIPWTNIYGSGILVDVIRNRLKAHGYYENTVIVSPDNGAVRRTTATAKALGIPDIAIVHKHRNPEIKDKSEVIEVVGDVKPIAVITDDVANTLGTAVHAAEALLERGAEKVIFVGIHAVLSDGATSFIQQGVLDHIYLTDTVETRPEIEQFVGERIYDPYDPESYQHTENPSKPITIVSAAPALAKEIKNTHLSRKHKRHIF